MMGSGEIIYEKVFAVSLRRLPPKISLRNDWMKELGSEVAGEDSQQTQPKTKNPTKMLEAERETLSVLSNTIKRNNPVRVFRKSKTFLTWLRKHQ